MVLVFFAGMLSLITIAAVSEVGSLFTHDPPGWQYLVQSRLLDLHGHFFEPHLVLQLQGVCSDKRLFLGVVSCLGPLVVSCLITVRTSSSAYQLLNNFSSL